MSPVSDAAARRFAPGSFLCGPAEGAQQPLPAELPAETPGETPAVAACLAPTPWVLGDGLCAPFSGLAGILNVTPDSFSDGGRYTNTADAVAHGLALLDEGAIMLDVGAESTRPGAVRVRAEEEARRLLPVLAGVLAARPEALVSVDTYKAQVARLALEGGARIINDVSACDLDPALPEVLASFRPGYVLMHHKGVPAAATAPVYDRVSDDVCAFFEAKMSELTRAGLPEDRIVLDPGIGFGKNPEQSFELLRDVERLTALGRPLYLGLSMKSLFGGVGLPLAERGEATRLATVLLALGGVRYHRVHEVAKTRQALRLAALLEPVKRVVVL